MSKSDGWYLLIVVAVILGSTTAVWAESWEHIHTSEGVDVYEKDAGDDVMFRGVKEANVTIDKLVAAYVDPNQRPHWVNNYADHETFERDEASELYWLQLDMPFGVSDRDYLLHADYQFDEARRTFEATTRSVEDDRKPEDDCCVRAETRTEYTFEAIPGEEKTRVEVIVQTDLKGRVPGRIVERAQRDWPVGTLNQLVERAAADDIDPDSRAEGWHSE